MKRVHLDEIETLPIAHLNLQWKPVRQALGVSAFGINAYHAPRQGDLVVEEHADPQQELYFVLRGRAHFRAGDQEFDAPAGTFVLLEPNEHRVAHAAEPDTLVVAVGAEASRFDPSAWEYAFRAKALFDLGRYEEAQRVVDEGVERYPGHADLLYTRACLAAHEGDDDGAVLTLVAAANEYPGVLEWAEVEEVLARVRDDPRLSAARALHRTA